MDFNLTKLIDLSSAFAKLTPLEIRTIECYARLEEELEENKFDLHGVYSPWDSNPYKSELGLDGKTK